MNKIIYDILVACTEEFYASKDSVLFNTFAQGLKKHRIGPVATDLGPEDEGYEFPRKYRQDMPHFDH